MEIATIAGVDFHTYHAFKPYVLIIRLHDTQTRVLKLRRPNGNAFRAFFRLILENSLLQWREREGGRCQCCLSVMNGSADPFRSPSSMITILINMCFIAPLKHTHTHTLHLSTFLQNCVFTLWTCFIVCLYLKNVKPRSSPPETITCYTHSLCLSCQPGGK